MSSDNEVMVRRLQHEKNIWRGIAIGLAATLILMFLLAGGFGFFLLRQAQLARMIAAEEARAHAEAQREAAVQAQLMAEQARQKPAQKPAP